MDPDNPRNSYTMDLGLIQQDPQVEDKRKMLGRACKRFNLRTHFDEHFDWRELFGWLRFTLVSGNLDYFKAKEFEMLWQPKKKHV